ncbi:MAG: hypothetical protein ACOC1K_01835 [Nanoarchaeota archaeon]
MVYCRWINVRTIIDVGTIIDIIFEKTFQNKTILLAKNENEKIKLIILDRNNQINHKKNSIRNILKYLRKNLDKKEYLEAERSIFTVN